MVSEFPAVKLGEVARVRSGFAFRSNDWLDAGIPVVKMANVKDGRLVMSNCSFVSAGVAAAADFSLRRNDIVISMTGAYIGDVAWVHQADIPAVLNQRVGLFSIPDDNLLDKRFLFYVLHSPETRAEIYNLGYGSAQPNVSPALIHGIEIPLPELQEQRAIGGILGALDDKIDLNRRMNQTLEAIARAIFKSWFVDPEAIVSASVTWRSSTIGNEVTVLGGSTPRTTEARYWGGEFNFLTPRDMSSLVDSIILETERTITAEGLSQISSGILEPGTVLLSSRAPIGYLAITEVPVAVNQGFIAMVCDRDLPNYYVLQWARHNMDTIIGNANGTTFLEISKKNFRPIEVLVPPREILDRFVDLVRPLYERITSNLRESKTLTAIRDALLPKLLSGEIRVKQAEQIVGGVV